jgi:hypothetical protein
MGSRVEIAETETGDRDWKDWGQRLERLGTETGNLVKEIHTG